MKAVPLSPERRSSPFSLSRSWPLPLSSPYVLTRSSGRDRRRGSEAEGAGGGRGGQTRRQRQGKGGTCFVVRRSRGAAAMRHRPACGGWNLALGASDVDDRRLGTTSAECAGDASEGGDRKLIGPSRRRLFLKWQGQKSTRHCVAIAGGVAGMYVIATCFSHEVLVEGERRRRDSVVRVRQLAPSQQSTMPGQWGRGLSLCTNFSTSC